MDYQYLGERKIKKKKINSTIQRFTIEEEKLIDVVSKLETPQEKWNYLVKLLEKHFGKDLTSLAISRISKSSKRKFLRYNVIPFPIEFLMENKLDKLKNLPVRTYR